MKDCKVGIRNDIRQSVAHDSVIGSKVEIGPFAHIRPESSIHDEVKVGNFVEIKKSEIGKGSKAAHLSYIGDAEVGTGVNLGCGSITVNYDGKNKHLTKIEDDVFVGCNSNLVAPVTVGKGAYIAAGSTITEDVPGQSLSIARARQVNKENYVQKLNLKINWRSTMSNQYLDPSLKIFSLNSNRALAQEIAEKVGDGTRGMHCIPIQ